MATNGDTGSNYAGDNAAFVEYTPSVYKWTDPPRFFKANDPYWYQLDNLPLKQIHENCKWLKDQVSVGLRASGVGRSELNELQPYAEGADRRVWVRPGRFMGRVNDAYNKGIATFQQIKRLDYKYYDSTTEIGVRQEDSNITLRDKVFASLIGYDIEASSSFPSNGLYDHLQHHQVRASTDSGDTPYQEWQAGAWGSTFETAVSGINNILNTPGNKLALWQGLSKRGYGPAPHGDLQQFATDYTRRWGGVGRTSLVDVGEEIGIDIPSFADSDFAVAQNITPSVRIDLVFIYTHPVDSKSTSLIAPNGNSPTTITAPRLGVLKGAGIVTVENQGDFTNEEADIQATPTLTDSSDWLAIRDNPALWYAANPDHGFNQGDQAFQMRSPIADQVQQTAGMPTKNLYGSFPSPDDLMNLTPLLDEELAGNAMSLLGQSVLPVAYVMVKKGQSSILPQDVIDIRPFFRTTELSYNERTGIAAALPPVSLANPAASERWVTGQMSANTKAIADGLQAIKAMLPSQFERTMLNRERYTVFTNINGASATGTYDITAAIPSPHRQYIKSICLYTEMYTTHDINDSNIEVRTRWGYPDETEDYKRIGRGGVSQSNGDIRRARTVSNQAWIPCYYDETTETVQLLVKITGTTSVKWWLYFDGYQLDVPVGFGE